MNPSQELSCICKTLWGCEPTVKISRFIENNKPRLNEFPIYTVELLLPDKRRFQTTGYNLVSEMKDQLCQAALRCLGHRTTSPIERPLNAPKKEIPRKERWRVHVHGLLDFVVDKGLLKQYPDVTFIVFTTSDAVTQKTNANYHEVEVCPKLDSKMAANKIVLRMINETQLAYLSIVVEAIDNVLGDNLMGVSVLAPEGSVTDAIPFSEQNTFVKLFHTGEDLRKSLMAFRAVVPLSK